MEAGKRNEFTLKMPDSTYRKLRLMAADIDIPINDLLIEIIEKSYDDIDIILPQKRVTPVPENQANFSMTQSMRLLRGERTAAESEK
ncbi:MAG: hypothetical protein M0Z81_10685 [Deltaproteobacteria bacterium]|jgi:hypothetical protein|nr:hypothetical protein [Deltaproteobacteria bacterium]